MLNCELIVEENGTPYPNFMGKVLDGFFESAVRFHAPHLEGILRPHGLDEIANFSILPPPVNKPLADSVRFSIMLHGTAAKSWMDIAIALNQHQYSGIHGRRSKLQELSLQQPESHRAIYLMRQGKFLPYMPELKNSDHLFQLASKNLSETKETRLYQLVFHSPLRIASRGAKGIEQQLPWPTLGGILESIAAHLRVKQPQLAEQLGIDKAWHASSAAEQTQALCFAAEPASQQECEYPSSVSRPERPDQAHGAQRPKTIRGIVGTLIYPATGGKQEQMLLHWGQWTGVGQKTTAGFGNYTLISI